MKINSRFELDSDIIEQKMLFFTVITFIVLKAIIIIIYMTIFAILGDSVGDRYTRFHSGIDLFDLLGTRWDSNLYIGIANFDGYTEAINNFDGPQDFRLWVFPPLYPFLIWLTKTILPFQISLSIVAVLITNLFSIFSVIVFYKTAKIYTGPKNAFVSTLIFAFFPPVFVFSTVAYTEPIFLTFALLSWYFFEKSQYSFAGVSLALATLTRNEGALLFFLYFIIYLARIYKAKGFQTMAKSIIAIPLFPILVINQIIQKLIKWVVLPLSFQQSKFIKRFELLNAKIYENFKENANWLLLWGLIPFLWLMWLDNNAPLPINQIRFNHWGASIGLPFSNLFSMLASGDIRWTIEKYMFVFLILLIGLLIIKEKPVFSFLVISQALFYTGYVAAGNSIVRYMASIFHAPLAMAQDSSINIKTIIIVLFIFSSYNLMVLWEFTHWSIWLI